MFFTGLRLLGSLWGLIVLALAVWAAWWTYNDANSKNMLGWLWAAVSFLFFPLGLIVYLIARAFAKPKTTS
jgi:putative effector of murein hydrolase LrgA (UPF0299 family)